MKRPASIRDILSGSLSFPGLKSILRDARIKRVWQDVVGSRLATKCEPHFLKDGVLHVRVLSSVWLTELGFHTNLIKEKLNQRLGDRVVEKIVFRVGMGRPSRECESPSVESERELTEEERRFIEERVSTVKDPLVRDTIRRAMEKALRLGGLKE